jgi:hypothetical protein
LPVFRATAISWAAAKYPARKKKLATACRTAAAALVAQSTGSTWGSGYAAAASRAAEYAAVVTIRDTASADAANAAVAAVDALAAFGAGLSLGFNLDLATAFGANPVVDAFWAAVSIDATRVEEGAAASVIADLPLWPHGQPNQLQSLWQEMIAALLAANQDWLVWIHWYDLRLSGHCRDEELELAYVRIEEALWDQGPSIVNAEIKRRIQEIPPPIAGAAAQSLSEIFAAWQSADAASAAPHLRRQYVPDVVFNPVALGAGGTPPTPRPWANTLATIPESPFGNKWTERGDRLAIDPRGNETDDTAALDPVVGQLHDAVRRKAIAFATNLMGIDDRIGWTGFEDVIERFRDALDVDTVAIPSRIATVYDATIEFASFLEFDNELRERFEGNVTPLNPTARRAFEDLVRTAAPWIRHFPTARRLDDETGALLLRRDLYEPSRAVVEGARNAALISAEDRNLLKALLSAIERGGFPAQKAGTRGILSTRNLIVAALMTAVTGSITFYSGAVSADFANRSELVKKIGTFLAAEESQVLRIMGDATTDLRLAISSLLAELKHSYGDDHSSAPSADHYAIVNRRSRQEDGK